MIVGSVFNSEAVIPLRLVLSDGSSKEIRAIVDTGFTDWIALPREMISALALQKREGTQYMLADGSSRSMRNYSVAVEWLDRIRHVLVVEIDGAPLIGMAMLRGSRLTIDVTPNGRVVIEPLPASS